MALDPYTTPLDKRTLTHLLRRTGFGASPADINAHLGRPASDVVDQLVAEALETPPPPMPNWASIPVPDRNTNTSDEIKEYNQNNRTWLLSQRAEWLSLMRTVGLREKMVLFWHNHFVTSVEEYEYAALAYRYMALLRSHALGNFVDFVHDIGLSLAMLIYLNGVDNDIGNPNENYARELLELFTMSQWDQFGNMNYTQADIEEIARALTGWEINLETFVSSLNSRDFDDGAKTIFGRRGNFVYSHVIEIIFDERSPQVAYYICSKLYQEFVYEEPDPAVVQDMADLLLANNFQIAPVVSALLKSNAFFNDQVIGAKIKSPIEFIIGLLVELDYEPGAFMLETLYEEVESMELGQELLSPPDVSGWAGYRSWISTDTLNARWSITDFILYNIRNGQALDLVPLMSQIPEASDPFAAFLLPLAIAQKMLPVKIEELDIPQVDEEFNGDLIGNPIPGNILNRTPNEINLAKLFLRDVPWYEWDIGEDGANQVLLDYVLYLAQLPEYQLT